MLNFKIVLAFIFFTGISSDYVIDHVFKKMVNSSVEVCDNFYRHFCGVGTRYGMDRLANETLEEDYNNFTVTDDTSEYMMELIKCGDTEYERGTVSNKLKMLFEEAIQNGEEEQFLKNMATVRNFTGDKNQFLSFLESWESDLVANYTKGCQTVVAFNKEKLWLHKNKNVIAEFQTMFDELKTIFHTWIDETPFLKKNDVVKQLHERLLILEFNNMSNSEEISKLTVEYKNCQRSLGKWLNEHNLVNIICIDNNYQLYHFPRRLVDTRFNAGNSVFFVNLGLPFYAIASRIETKPFLIGSLGSVIGHEISHTIMRLQDSDYFSQRTTNCIQNQFYKTCDIFNVTSEYNKKIGDKGSDLLGFRGVLQFAKNHFGAALYEPNDKYPEYTNLQLLFIGQAAFSCNVPSWGIGHSPFPIRSNAVAAQNSEFIDAFKCASDSRMSKSLHKKCYILGPDTSSE